MLPEDRVLCAQLRRLEKLTLRPDWGEEPLRETKCGSDVVPDGYWSKLLGLMAKLPAAIEPPGPDPEPFV